VTTLAMLLFLAAGKDAGVDRWDFEDGVAVVHAKGATRDSLSALALEKLGIALEGPLTLKVSAKANTVGGVTLRLADPGDARAYCDLYATRAGEALRFTDSRCSFGAFSGQLRTVATCRRIAGEARRLDDGRIALEARSPDCSAQPMGVPLSISGTLSPR
jgi:hypothetical protein